MTGIARRSAMTTGGAMSPGPTERVQQEAQELLKLKKEEIQVMWFAGINIVKIARVIDASAMAVALVLRWLGFVK